MTCFLIIFNQIVILHLNNESPFDELNAFGFGHSGRLTNSTENNLFYVEWSGKTEGIEKGIKVEKSL